MPARRIKYFREQKNLSQQELADKMGVCWQTVRYWERGERSPPYEKLVEMSKLLGISRRSFFAKRLDVTK